MGGYKVLLVDDEKLLLDSLEIILSLNHMEITGKANDGREALQILEEKAADCDIALVDLNMKGMGGTELIKIMKQRFSDIKILVLTTFYDDKYITEAIAGGADGYLLKDSGKDTILGAITQILSGITVLDQKVMARLTELMAGNFERTDKGRPNGEQGNVSGDISMELTEYDTVYDSADWADMYKELVTDQLDAALLAILTVVIIFLAISILVAYVSFMRSRVNEYCLYSSIGFARKDIYEMMMREIGIIFGLSIVIGAAVTVVIMVLLGHFMLDSLGLVYHYFYPEHLLRILTAFLAIVGFLQVPVIVTINNIKTIDMIEE